MRSFASSVKDTEGKDKQSNEYKGLTGGTSDRAMKLEGEYNKLHGRILKLIDSMRAHGIDVKRLDLDERKHTLAKQRLSGEYSIDPDTGEIDDAPDDDSGADA